MQNKTQIYTTEQIKDAFWKTFHEEGEIFFDYLGSADENRKSTDSWWQEFLENLPKNDRIPCENR